MVRMCMRSAVVILFFICSALPAAAQQVHQEVQETVGATVREVLSERERSITGTDTYTTVQELSVRIEEGERAGEVVELENDLTVLEEGDRIFVNRLERIDGSEYYLFKDYDRRGMLLMLGGLFFALLVVFAGWQGVRAVASLLLSVGAIFFVLVPLLLDGYSPVVVSMCVASIILALVLFGTHGVAARSVIAFFGTMSAVVVTGFIALLWVDVMRLTGLSSDASVYLNISTSGALDFGGLLLGSIIIGILGVLDDVSVTQASVVQELKSANPTLRLVELYRRAIRVGRDHVGSLVNTLALAYIGVSLPLVLLLVRADAGVMLSINQEIVAAELVRIIVGSIGLILAVPFTTAIAAWWFDEREVPEGALTAHHGHGHHH